MTYKTPDDVIEQAAHDIADTCYGVGNWDSLLGEEQVDCIEWAEASAPLIAQAALERVRQVLKRRRIQARDGVAIIDVLDEMIGDDDE